MGPEEVLIEFVMNIEEQISQIKLLEDEILALQGVVDEFHKRFDKIQTEQQKSWKTQTEMLIEISDTLVTIGKHYDHLGKSATDMGVAAQTAIQSVTQEHTEWQQTIAKANDGLDSGYKKAVLLGGVTLAGSLFLKSFHKMMEATEAIIRNTEYMRVSSALSAKELDGLVTGLQDAANRTGMDFAELSQKAKAIYDFTGVTKGLGQIIEAGSYMNKVFGLSGDEFERFAAFTIKWSHGATNAVALMEQFDNVVGLTGDKMDTLLSNLTQIGRQLGKIVGGGAKFGSLMEKVTKGVAEMTAEFQQLGGEGELVSEVFQKAADPSQWNDLVKMLGPGIGGYLTELNAAATSGDMETFRKALVAAAQDSESALSALPPLARASTSFDFKAIDDFSRMSAIAGANTKALQSQASVQERAQKLMLNFNDQLGRLWNNIISVFMQAFMPTILRVLQALNGLADAMSNGQDSGAGFVVVMGNIASALGDVIIFGIKLITWFVELAGTANSVGLTLLGIAASGMILLGFTKVLGAAINWIVGLLGKVLVTVAKSAGEAVGAAMEAMANSAASIGSRAGEVIKGALALMLLGVAVGFFAASVYLFSQSSLAGLGIMMLTLVSLIVLVGVLGALMAGPVGVAILLGIGTLLLLGAALAVVGAAMLLFSVAATIFVAAFERFGPAATGAGEGLADLATGINTIADARYVKGGIAIAWISSALSAIPNLNVSGFAASIKELMAALHSIAESTEDTKTIANILKSDSKELETVMTQLFGKDSFLLSAVKIVDEALNPSGWFNDVTLTKEDIGTITGIFDILNELSKSLVDILTVSLTLKESGPEISNAIKDLFGDGKGNYGIIGGAVRGLDAALTTGWDVSIDPTQVDNIKKMVEIMSQLSTQFDALYALYWNMNWEAWKDGPKRIDLAKGAITQIFGDGETRGSGILGQMMVGLSTSLDDSGLTTDAVANVEKVLGFVNTIGDTIEQLTIAGVFMNQVLDDGRSVFKTARDATYQLFGKGEGIFDKMAWYMSQSFGHYSEGAFKTSNEAMDAMCKWMGNLVDFVSEMGIAALMLDSETTGGKLSEVIRKMTTELFDPSGGIFTLLASSMTQGFNQSALPNSAEAFGGLNAYADNITNFLDKTQNWSNGLNRLERFSLLLSDAEANMNESVSIRAEGGAELAMNEYTSTRTAHEEVVEQLLTDIRDGIFQVAATAPANQIVNKTQPGSSFNPADLFSVFGSSEGEF